MPQSTMPRLPRMVGLLARPLPLLPLSLALTRLARRMVERHPGILTRLGSHADCRYLFDLTDLPFVLLAEPGGPLPRVAAFRRARPPAYDARITGTTSAFLGMMHGEVDGDALFFSRDLAIEGDTEAVLALRNAIDDAELDLSAEIVAVAGPLGAPMRTVLPLAEHLSGLTLHRVDPFAEAVP